MAERALFLDRSSAHDQSIPVYTDGSKSDAGVGFGVVFPNFSRGCALPPSLIFTAELSAILSALTIIFTLPQRSFTVFSDSHNALESLTNFISQHPLLLSF